MHIYILKLYKNYFGRTLTVTLILSCSCEFVLCKVIIVSGTIDASALGFELPNGGCPPDRNM